ncbi:hypothetical protein CV770_12445 [Bradyrhizobium sp. AC87j1]|uniref:hypothetical protein n=1 Tax=Bradyrhizobium sp. AC87j1 TaxID=2055894 RepID=UPI000CEC5D31|nr:hypothetical protein [Bradyrhizobium sp. AC87j1]PPQ19112.1 hypothetical protein CV770_12445 [Bradyrhizobium sp. AC87j1]
MFSGSITPKEGRHFLPTLFAIGSANGAARGNCIAEGESAAKMHAWAQFRIARPDRKSSKFSQMTHCASSKDCIARKMSEEVLARWPSIAMDVELDSK